MQITKMIFNLTGLTMAVNDIESSINQTKDSISFGDTLNQAKADIRTPTSGSILAGISENVVVNNNENAFQVKINLEKQGSVGINKNTSKDILSSLARVIQLNEAISDKLESVNQIKPENIQVDTQQLTEDLEKTLDKIDEKLDEILDKNSNNLSLTELLKLISFVKDLKETIRNKLTEQVSNYINNIENLIGSNNDNEGITDIKSTPGDDILTQPVVLMTPEIKIQNADVSVQSVNSLTQQDLQLTDNKNSLNSDGFKIKVTPDSEIIKNIEITALKSLEKINQLFAEKVSLDSPINTDQLKAAINPEMTETMKNIQKILDSSDLKVEIFKPIINQTNQQNGTINYTNITQITDLKNISPENKGLNSLKDLLNEEKNIDVVKTNKNVVTNPNQIIDSESSLSMFNVHSSNTQDPILSSLKANFATLNNETTPTFLNSNRYIDNNKVVNQVINKIRESYNKNEISIDLKPSTLGSVKVNITMHKGVLTAAIIADTAKAAESLKTGTETLKQTLIDNGINVSKIIVVQADQNWLSNSNNNNDSNKNQNLQDNNNAGKEKDTTAGQQQNKQTDKDTNELSQQFKNAKNSHKNLNGRENQINNSHNHLNTEENNETENNYIDTSKGFVNYRV